MRHVDHADSGGASDARVGQCSFVAQASVPEDQGRLFDDAPSDRTEARQQGANPAAWSGFHCVAHRLARNGFVKFHVDRTGTMRWRIFPKREMAVVRLGFSKSSLMACEESSESVSLAIGGQPSVW